ncbi:hypothetical protein B7T07_20640 [Cronobacter sakazakii]|uniref:Uncharacterized protein n=1 Tax=Cronobacter sakazakii TaxID=28141 RepID=A0AA45BYB1_CROSK|nr:hypothetical protein B7T07_20640 [Cronobacter sakazakii]
MARKLQCNWHIFILPDKEIFNSFYLAMESFGCPFGHSVLPENLHYAPYGNDPLQLIWLPRENPRSLAVAKLLSQTGFPDFNHILLRHIQQASRT